MVKETEVLAEGLRHTVIISDEPEALLAAKAAGRAIIGVETGELPAGSPFTARYVVPDWELATEELARLVLLRHLGLPWTIGVTERLLIRELTVQDGGMIPADETLSREEELFRDGEKLRAYIRGQYGFYEYGTWAVVRCVDGILVGLAGVSQPRLPEDLNRRLEAYIGRYGGVGADSEEQFLELGYRIFRPYRRRGYASEACREILSYTRQVMNCRVCAMVETKNKASRRLAERLGMKRLSESGLFTETDSLTSEQLLLYAETHL